MTTQPPLRLLIPRPQRQARDFAAQVDAAMPGRWSIDIAPLFDIEMTQERFDLSDVDALVFTSRNGVAAFAATDASRALPAYCVGAQTTKRAQDAGLLASCVGADLADLSAALRDLPPQKLLHVRGAHVAGVPGESARQAGHRWAEVVAYDQPARALPDSLLAELADGRVDAVTLFSPRTARLLAEQTAARGLSPSVTLVCLSPAVAQATGHPAASLRVCTSPDAQAMLIALKAFA